MTRPDRFVIHAERRRGKRLAEPVVAAPEAAEVDEAIVDAGGRRGRLEAVGWRLWQRENLAAGEGDCRNLRGSAADHDLAI
jgi:hypothetical protein